MLQREIEELRTFKPNHRAHLKSYLKGKLIELEQTSADETSRWRKPAGGMGSRGSFDAQRLVPVQPAELLGHGPARFVIAGP